MHVNLKHIYISKEVIMTLKYTSPLKVGLYIIMAILNSMKAVFVAYMLKLFISYAEKPQGSLLKLTTTAICGLLIFGVIGIIFQYLYSRIIADVNIKIKELSSNYLVKSRRNSGKIDTSFMTNDLKQIETNRTVAELTIIFDVIQFISAIASAFLASWIIALIFVVASFAPAILQGVFGPLIAKKSEKWEKTNSHYTETVTETGIGANIAKLYDVEESIISRLIHAVRKMEIALMEMNWTKGISNELTTIVAFIFGIMLPFSLGVYFISIGFLTLGTFMMIVQLSNNFINPVISIFESINDIKTTSIIWKKFEKVIAFDEQEKNTVQENIGLFTKLTLSDIGVKLNQRQIFKDINLSIKNGEKVLLKAPSGWGKSTLLNVMTGNYAPSTGTYEINQQEVDGDWDKAHEYFSFIQQKPFVLDDTLRYNITLGREISDNELNDIAEKAGLADLVQSKGWDYQVGCDGRNLSGGQNQRIEIARALVAKRPILLADEATSSLDPELSKKIHQTILHDFTGTVIEVAHHISSEEQELFDRVIELDK